MSTFWTVLIAIVAYEIVKSLFRFVVGCTVAYLEWKEELRMEEEWRRSQDQKKLEEYK